MRRAGILLHLSSLPGPYGVGTMGREARAFVEFLAAAGQQVWQLLPLGPTSYGDSPYQSFSAFAGNPYFIDLETLVADGLLSQADCEATFWGSDAERVDYGALYENRWPLLRQAVSRFFQNPPPDWADFCRRHSHWLSDYALFMALKDAHAGQPWWSWEPALQRREPAALDAFSSQHADALRFWQGVQYLFFRQWQALKDYGNARGVSFLGDMPIYVAEDSADVWANPSLFQLGPDLRPTQVAGCPPDGFSDAGQLWGNPLFDWDRMAADHFAWWQQRVAHQKALFDLLRIDHFRGLSAYYAIPFGDGDARRGQWRQGPGWQLLAALAEGPGLDNIIAEDLGFLDDDVRQLLHRSGLPGMKVLQFAFDSREDSDYLPHNYNRNCVVYTGTHDNDTALGWFTSAPVGDTERATAYLALTEAEGLHWGLMRGAWSSVGDLAVVQMQDVLGLGSEQRMNTPSTLGGNWLWRMLPGAADAPLADKLRRRMALYQRLAR